MISGPMVSYDLGGIGTANENVDTAHSLCI